MDTEPTSPPRRGPLGKPSFIQTESSLSPISEKPTLDNKSAYISDLPRLNSIPTTEPSLPPARSTAGSGILPRIRTSSGAGSQGTPVEQHKAGGPVLPDRNFSSSPVPEHEPALPTPRPATGDSSRGPQSFGSFSVISGRAGTPPVVAPSPSNRSSFDVVRVASPLRSQSPTSPPRSRMNPLVVPDTHTPSPVVDNAPKPVQSPPISPNPNANISSNNNSQPPKSPPPVVEAASPPTSSIMPLIPRKPPLVGVTLRDDQFARSPTSTTTTTTTTTRSATTAETNQIPSGSGSGSPRPLPTTPVRTNTSSTSADESPGEYHQKPTVVSVTAVSPAPRRFDVATATAPVTSDPVPENDYGLAGYSESRKPFGRRPSGARAPPVKRTTVSDSAHSQISTMSSQLSNPVDEDVHASADALVALSFLSQEEDDAVPPLSVTKRNPTSPRLADRPPMPTIAEPDDPAPSHDPVYRSSFAPSKTAAERKARSQAAQAASQAATLRPGRPTNGGNGQLRKDRGAWESSEDEDEEEEEEDEVEDDEDAVPTQVAPRMRFNQPEAPGAMYQPIRPARLLPQIPASRSASDSYSAKTDSDRGGPPKPGYHEQEARMRQRSYSPDRGPPPQHAPHPEYAHQVPSSRQALWSTVLDPKNSNHPPHNSRDTFVNLDEDSHVMTKAFQPQGLLSAGLQDKQDRSAKRQEELARESGASLVNVPSKPPPPQTGLLGAITGYERERKREGGVGAALTERERDRRLAENRQRRLDDFQRMQLDQQQQMAQGGGTYSMYGNPYMGSPMMGSPMMMGGGMMGGFPYPGMMGGFNNPQHMFAAQQAAQAYQQAMFTYSTAGSQVGGENNLPQPPNQPQGMGMLSPGGYDPRMSMMGMGMMGPMSMGGWDPRMSMFAPGTGMDYHNPAMMQNPGLMPQHTGLSNSQFGPPQPPFSAQQMRANTPPSRGSANQSPVPPTVPASQSQQLQQPAPPAQ